jgi:hypothetical protein
VQVTRIKLRIMRLRQVTHQGLPEPNPALNPLSANRLLTAIVPTGRAKESHLHLISLMAVFSVACEAADVPAVIRLAPMSTRLGELSS